MTLDRRGTRIRRDEDGYPESVPVGRVDQFFIEIPKGKNVGTVKMKVWGP
jgi:hypothetical protein